MSTPVTASSSASAPMSPADVVAAIQAAVPQVTKVVELTAANDPNELLGRPNGYTAAWKIYDSRAECDSPLDTTCGATIEVWPTTADAKSRSAYIQGILKKAPMLGTEYDTVSGAILLRVTGNLTPGEAAAYARVLDSSSGAMPSSHASPASAADELRANVQAYSDAYLTGQPIKAYNLLSKR